MSLRNDIMRFSVLGLRSDLRIELQAPVDASSSQRKLLPSASSLRMFSTEHIKSSIVLTECSLRPENLANTLSISRSTDKQESIVLGFVQGLGSI